ncbi:hypothetical protein M406DRAFT_106902 [Cryphonectria parasitica EP155]|uniref:Polyketide synthase n=1 Tax=Cryphonectria parasitica (strain ATCC 38755 / EP155) TaxID=660469 RepID=A0A9P4Y757_CRYP1|nr:uncharacterized protein M406DRAFT_106902 [Cryphonectria parasitica EP155]KAF3768157.1 hypothetical protein M406DRAFT_106902 [Cryphonectria parasitica EP155]
MTEGIANSAKVPKARFNIDAYLHPSNERPGSFNVPGGYFLNDDIEAFDPGMFGNMSRVEALCMDPQQHFRHAYTAIGVDSGMLANRVSFVFDLRGPSVTVNTACSSSMYALHLACQAMAQGDCDGAVVGGTNLILNVDQQMNTARMGVLSPTNQCHTFDEAADGYGRADGVGALYLRPLRSAIRDGDPIRAVIRSTAAGSSGKCKDGITHPSVQGQMDVIATAYKRAGLSTDETAYVECHGTGTPVGDPIEVEAIQRAMGISASRSDPVLIGSIKPNVGHSEAASSMATVIKAVLALEKGIIPPTAGVKKLQPSIPWDTINVQVVTQPFVWTASNKHVRRIDINAFGYGAHDEPTLRNILIDYSTLRVSNSTDMLNLAYTLGCRRTKLPWRSFGIARAASLGQDVLAASAGILHAGSDAARPAFIFTGQGAQWARMGAELLQLYPLTTRETTRKLDRHLSQLKSPPSWTIEQIMQQPKETSVINEAEYAQPLCTAIQIMLVDLLYHWSARPLATVGHSSGEIAAAYAAGRISAEDAITTAYLRGKLAASLGDNGAMLAVGLGAEDVARKYLATPEEPWSSGRVVVACHNSASAVTLSGDAQAVEALRLLLEDDRVFTRMVKTGGKAYHSHHMKTAAGEYEKQLRLCSAVNVGDLLPKLPMFSTVNTSTIRDDYIPASYWVDSLVSPVLFEQGVSLMLREMPDINLLIEVGPHASLAGPLRQILQAENKALRVNYLSTLKRGEHDGERMLSLAASLWAKNGPIDVGVLLESEDICKRDATGSEVVETKAASLLLGLPTYHWTYSIPCWTEPRMSREQRQMPEPRHDILGRRVLGTSALEPMWRNILRQKDLPWLSHHRLGGEVMLPGAGYLALAIEAITQINQQEAVPAIIDSYTIRDVTFSSATVIPDNDTGTETLFRMQPVLGRSSGKSSLWYGFSASCYSYGNWKETARGKVGINVFRDSHQMHNPDVPSDAPWRKAKHIHWLDKLRTLGVDLGPAFHRIDDIYTSAEHYNAHAELTISNTCGLLAAESRYLMHPSVIDSCMQLSTAATHRGDLDAMHCGTIPTHIGEATFFVPSVEHTKRPSKVHAWTPPPLGTRAFTSHVLVNGFDGSVLLQLSGFRHVYYSAAVPHEMRGPMSRDLYLHDKWNVDAKYLESSQAASFSEVVEILLHKYQGATRILCLDPELIPFFLTSWPRLTVVVGVASSQQDKKSMILARYGERVNLRFLDVNENLATAPNGNSTDLSQREGYELVASSSGACPEGAELASLLQMLSPNARLVIQDGKTATIQELAKHIGSLLEPIGILADGSIVARRSKTCNTGANGSVVMVKSEEGHSKIVKKSVPLVLHHEQSNSPLLDPISQRLASAGWTFRCGVLGDPDLICEPYERVVLLDDDPASGAILAHVDQDRLRGVINLTESASSLVWITRGGLLTGDRPEYGMTTGAARVIRTEKGSGFDLVTVDYDHVRSGSGEQVAVLVSDILRRQHTSKSEVHPGSEKEYCIKSGAVYIPRLVQHNDVNTQFVLDSGINTTLDHQHYQRAAVPAVQAQLEQVTGALTYRVDGCDPRSRSLEPDELQVHVAAIGLTADDGVDDTHFLSHQFAGTVVRAGHNANEEFPPGTPVAGFASGFSGQLATFQHTSSRLVFSLASAREDGKFGITEAATIPSAFVVAMYGLKELARVEPDENVLIVDGMGAVGLAAVQLCRVLGAKVIFVTLSEASRRVLVDSGLVGSSCQVILWSHERDQGNGQGCLRRLIQDALTAKGSGCGSIDAVLCSASVCQTSVLEAVGPCLSELARIAVVGKTEARGDGDSILSAILPSIRGLSLSYFQLRDVAERRPRVFSRILRYCGDLYRQGAIQHIHPITELRPSEVLKSPVPADIGPGIHVVRYDEGTSFEIDGPLSPSPLRFRANATYLLVGCLGGLGRAVALWMADRGARHVAEIRGRTPPGPPIRGVLNAAGVLHDGLFSNMTAPVWHQVTDAKVEGCLNLHHVFSPSPANDGGETQTLDFFVMTSSVACALGSGGQSNYAAANAFLDSLARHRRTRGLPAVSLILPAILGIGYISEHPELVKSFQGKGMYGIYEKEMLEAFGVALRPQGPPHGHDTVGDHLIVGVQPRRFGESIRAAGAHAPWIDDARYRWLRAAVEAQTGVHADTSGGGGQAFGSRQNILSTIREASSKDLAVEAATKHVAARLVQLLMLDERSLDTRHKSVGSYGLDSMIGAEFRNWLFREFGADIPFQQLLAGNATISELARMLCEKVLTNKDC